MSFESKNNMTATLEKPKETLVELVDKKMEQNISLSQAVNEVEREMGRFDYSHTAKNINQVYNEMDRQTVANAKGEMQEQEETEQVEKEDSLDRVKRSKTYMDVVQTFETPTLQINELEASKSAKKGSKAAKKVSKRMKLWMVTGACCFVMLIGLVVCNALSIGAIERNTALTENTLTQQEMVLDGVNGKVSAESSKIPENMKDSVHSGGSIDISPSVSTEVVTTDNFFNRLTEFISYLFGR